MSTIGLTPSAASGLDPAVVLLRDTQGFLYLPVFVESVLAASACLNYLQTHLSQQFYNLAWPIDELKTSLIGNLDDAINKLPRNSTIVLDASSKERHKLALEAAAYLNLRREPLRAAALRFIICWPIELKDELLAKTPDLWSMRALSPWVTNAELVFPENSSQNDAIFEDALSTIKTTGKPSASVDKKLAKWERHHDLKLADLSELDALKLANDLIDVRQYSVAVQIAEAVVHALQKKAPSATTTNPIKAAAFSLLAIVHSYLGNMQAALFVSQDAVKIYRRLALANPAAFESELAMSVNNLASSLSDTGDRAGALLAAQEAVKIYRRLATVKPSAFEPNLAMSVSNLANFLSKTNDSAGALLAAHEAVAIRRRLAAANPAAFEPDLSKSVSNLANRLSETGDYAGALLAAQEALAIHRRLAQANPAAFEPALATSMSNLANRLSETGDRAGAMLAGQEAVAIRRRLAQANPAAFEPDLATSMNNLANSLSETNDSAGALLAAQEALMLFESANKRHVGLFENEISRSKRMVTQLEKSNSVKT